VPLMRKHFIINQKYFFISLSVRLETFLILKKFYSSILDLNFNLANKMLRNLIFPKLKQVKCICNFSEKATKITQNNVFYNVSYQY
jgi:hypothetical protein